MENIFQKLEELREKQEKNLIPYLADFSLHHLQEIQEWTIDEFAKKANCSKPTLVRFCKEIGYMGFAEFKFKLKDYFLKKENHQLKFDSPEKIDSHYFEIAQASFQQVYIFYKKQKKQINRLIQEISQSRLIYIFGTNMSYHFSKTFCDWLRLLGLNVIHEKGSGLIDLYLSHLQEKDMVICFSLSGTSSWLKKAEPKLKKIPNYKFGVLGLNSPLGKLFDDFALLPQFENDFWAWGSIRAQVLAQFLDYLYFDLSKVISLQK